MRATRSSGSVEGVMGNHDPYSDPHWGINRPHLKSQKRVAGVSAVDSMGGYDSTRRRS